MHPDAAMFVLLKKSTDLCEPNARRAFIEAVLQLCRLEKGKHAVIAEHLYIHCKVKTGEHKWKMPDIPVFESLEDRDAANDLAAYELGLNQDSISHPVLDRLADAAIEIGNLPPQDQLSVASELIRVIVTSNDALDGLVI